MPTSSGRKLKICIVCHAAQGGSGILATELGLGLAHRGHEVHFVSHDLPFRLAGAHEHVVFHKVDVTTYPLFKFPPYAIALAGKLATLCEENSFDILHVHYVIPHAVSAYLCHQILDKNAPPVVTTLHGTDVTLIGADDEFREITGFVITHSEAVTAVSEFLATMTRMTFGVERRIDVIPNFIDPSYYTPELRDPEIRARYARDDEMLVGHMSNFRAIKRVSDVMRILCLLQQEVPARLLMVGEGEQLPLARLMAERLGIASKVDFVGPMVHVNEILAQMDVFLLPSEMESFGLAALEAMACGVPVICSRTGGLPEVVQHGVSGYLYPVGDCKNMADAAVRLLRDADLWRRMSQAARKKAAETYPSDRVISQYEELYFRLHDSLEEEKALVLSADRADL